MKKLFLLSFISLPIFGCSFVDTNKTYENEGVIQYSGITNQGDIQYFTSNDSKIETSYSAEIFESSGNKTEFGTVLYDSGNTLNITDNSIQYVNNIYGFSVSLVNGWSGGIIQNESRLDYISGDVNYPIISFNMLSSQNTMLPVLFIEVLDIEYYNKMANDSNNGPSALNYSIIGKNNKYYFGIEETNIASNDFVSLFPNFQLKCINMKEISGYERLDCGNRIDQIFINFQTFNI